MTIRVFYGGQLHKEFPVSDCMWPMSTVSKALREESLEIYNGAYCHVTPSMSFLHGWYRADNTPVRENDVPKELRLLLLLLS